MYNYRIKRKMGFSKSVSGKRFKNESRKEFFTRLSALLLEEYKKGYSVFIVAGKAMDNEDLRKNYLKDKNIVYENVSYADTGLKELLSRDSINAALGKARLSIQRKLMGQYLTGISKNEKLLYEFPNDNKLESSVTTISLKFLLPLSIRLPPL